MSDLLSHPQCFKNNKTDRSDAFNYSGSSSSSSVAEVFTKTTNVTSKPGLFIPDRDSIKQCVKKETYSSVENLWLKNWKSPRQKEPNLVIQTDVSKSGWEAFATVCQSREMVRDGREFESKYSGFNSSKVFISNIHQRTIKYSN